MERYLVMELVGNDTKYEIMDLNGVKEKGLNPLKPYQVVNDKLYCIQECDTQEDAEHLQIHYQDRDKANKRP